MASRRAAQIVTQYGVRSQTFVSDAIASVDARGWESWVVAMRRIEPAAVPYPPLDRSITWTPPSVPIRALDVARRRPGTDRFADAVAARVAAAEPEVLHAHFGWAGPIAARLHQRLGVPVVATFHATDVTVWPHQRKHGRRNGYDELFPVLSRALVVSNFIGHTLRDLGYRGPVELVPAGVSLERFPFAATAAPDAGRLRLLYVGRVVTRKGLDVLIRALPDVLAEHPDTVLEAVGDGPERSAYEALAAELGLQDRVRFVGAKAPDEILAAMRRAHLLVLPARVMPDGEVEGSPVVLKEALAAGVPVVATASGGSVEVLPPAYRQEIVQPGSASALAERICAVAADVAGWDERVRTGRRWVEEQYDWGKLGAQTARIYEQVVAAPADPRAPA